MEIIKRNLISIVCGVVALLTVVFVTIWPVPGWFEDLTQKLETSKADYDSLQDLNTSNFSKPIVDPTQTEGEDLGQFPNPKTIESGVAVIKELQEHATEAMKTVARMNKHEPLVPEALPTKKTGYAWDNYKIAYYAKLKELTDLMRAVTAPTDMEIQAEQMRLRDEAEKKIVRVAGTEVNRAEIEAQLTRQLATLADDMRRKRAKDYAVLLDSNTTMNACEDINLPTQDSSEMPNIEQIWASQVTLWIQEDVVRAIAETNGPNASVETSVIKRLVRWQIPKQYVTSSGRADIMNAALGVPGSEGAAAAEATANAKAYSISVTGRVSNPLYDVMHFTLVVDADALRFREFMANLVKSRFITVLRADLIGVDREREQSRGYLYGKSPVIRLALRCEIIFFRNWTTPLMPSSIKQMLMVTPGDSAGGMPVAGM